MDISRHLYLCIAAFSFYLVGIFLLWRIKSGGSTHIFMITATLMLGLAFNHFSLWWFHFNLSSGHGDRALHYFRAWWWPWRHITILIPLIWYAVHVTVVYWQNRHNTQHRRFSDLINGGKHRRRKTDK